MYAIIADGSKQYKVSPGETLEIERRSISPGEEIVFDKIVLFNDGKDTKIGKPYLQEVKVKGKVLKETKGEKLVVFKFRRRKNSKTKRGHRQKYTAVKIEEIAVS